MHSSMNRDLEPLASFVTQLDQVRDATAQM